MNRATVTETANGNVETYTGVTGNKFKERFNSHKSNFCHENTSLANHMWNLKIAGIDHQVKWSLVDRVDSFNPLQGNVGNV